MAPDVEAVLQSAEALRNAMMADHDAAALEEAFDAYEEEEEAQYMHIEGHGHGMHGANGMTGAYTDVKQAQLHGHGYGEAPGYGYQVQPVSIPMQPAGVANAHAGVSAAAGAGQGSTHERMAMGACLVQAQGTAWDGEAVQEVIEEAGPSVFQDP